MFVLSSESMRTADANAYGRLGDVQLMRNAGARLAEWLTQHADGKRVTAFAGPGNNGGDAFAAFAELGPSFERRVYAASCARPSAARADAESRARAAGVIIQALPFDARELDSVVQNSDTIVDALFGTGARAPLPREYESVVAAMNGTPAAVLAVDIPSGVDADSGAVGAFAVRAGATVTLGALKPGLLLESARDHVGELWFADIGIAGEDLPQSSREFAALDDAEFNAMLPARPQNSDKRRSGAPLLLAGSTQFPGAAVLCALGAARAGAGYVTVVTGPGAAPALRAHLIEQVVVTIDDNRTVPEAVDDFLETVKHATAVAMGPGLGLDERTGEIVRGIAQRLDLPFVADASGLFHFAKHLDILRGKRCVLTPHAGEFARLSGKGTVKPNERIERLREFVDRTGVTTLLKGNTTLIYDGTTMHFNTTGTNTLATAGTGDVLTGIIATLLSQSLTPVDAACAGAYWHGLAGRLCASERSRGVIAGDIPTALAAAIPNPIEASLLQRVF